MAKPNKNKPGLASTRPAVASPPKPEPEMAEAVQEVSTEAPAPAAAMPDDVGHVVAYDEPATAEDDDLAAALAAMSDPGPTISHEEVWQALGLTPEPMPAKPKSYVVIGGGSVKYEGKHYFPGQTIPMPDDMAAAMAECIGLAE